MSRKHKFPRRLFLRKVSVLGLGTTLGGWLSQSLSGVARAGQPKRSAPNANASGYSILGKVTSADFAPLVGETFQVYVRPGRSIPIVLVSADDLPMLGQASNLKNRRPPFSLMFQGPTGFRLTSDTYLVKHNALGTFPLFLTPVGHPKSGANYEAIFG